MNFRYKTSDALTPAERRKRIVELLAAACIRLVEEKSVERGRSREVKKLTKSKKNSLDSV